MEMKRPGCSMVHSGRARRRSGTLPSYDDASSTQIDRLGWGLGVAIVMNAARNEPIVTTLVMSSIREVVRRTGATIARGCMLTRLCKNKAVLDSCVGLGTGSASPNTFVLFLNNGCTDYAICVAQQRFLGIIDTPQRCNTPSPSTTSSVAT